MRWLTPLHDSLSLSLMYTKYYENMAILFSFLFLKMDLHVPTIFLVTAGTFMCPHFLDSHASLQNTWGERDFNAYDGAFM
jgi:hypothetical protein